MTNLEKGKFIKNFVRVDHDGKLVRAKHSNRIGYSSKDIENIEPQVDQQYWDNWEKYLRDIKDSENWTKDYSDWAHFLYALNSIPDSDIKKYDLPQDYIVVTE